MIHVASLACYILCNSQLCFSPQKSFSHHDYLQLLKIGLTLENFGSDFRPSLSSASGMSMVVIFA